MKKYVINLGELGGCYVRNAFILADKDSECMILPLLVETKEAAMTFKKKHLANAIAKLLDGKVEELE